MNLTYLDQDGVKILVLDGRLDATNVAQLDQTFSTALGEGGRQFVWDCSKLQYISSAGLRSVLQALKQLSPVGGRLALCSASPNVLEVFEISGFRPLVTICKDRAAAIEALT